MNKHVNKLRKEATDARRMIEDSDSDSADESDEESSKKNGEKPTEDQVERLEEKLEAGQADQKNLFLIIFQVRTTTYTFAVKTRKSWGKM